MSNKPPWMSKLALRIFREVGETEFSKPLVDIIAEEHDSVAMSEERLQQLWHQHGPYTWNEGQELAHEISRLLAAPAQPEYDVRLDLLVLLSWVRGLKTGEPMAPGEVDAMLKEQMPDLVTFAESRSAPAQPELDGAELIGTTIYNPSKQTIRYEREKAQPSQGDQPHITGCTFGGCLPRGVPGSCDCWCHRKPEQDSVDRARELVRIEVFPPSEHSKFRGEGATYRVLIGNMDALTTKCEKGAQDCANEYRRIIATYAASETAALRANYKIACDRLNGLGKDLDEKLAENERLQAIVATCERDIGLALADYHDSQAQLAQMTLAFTERESTLQGELAQRREALNAIDNLAAGAVCEKHINCPSCRIMEIAQSCSTASSAGWLKKHDAEVAAKALRDAGAIVKDTSILHCSSWGAAKRHLIKAISARADALAGEQPPKSGENK